MRLADTILIHCDTASSTAPVGQHPEPDGTVGRNKMRVGGPDKGGIVAGGPGSGRHPEGGGKKRTRETRQQKMEQLWPGETARMKDMPRLVEKFRELQKKDAEKKKTVQGTSGGQSEGSSLTALKYYVVDGAGRGLHTFRTRDEAESASAGNRYTKVVTHVEQSTPMEETPEVMDIIRRRPGDNQVRTFRRSLPFPNSPFSGSPQGR